MKLYKHQIRRIIREAIAPPKSNGEGGDANILLRMYLSDDLDDQDELQYLREEFSNDDFDELIAIYEGLIAVLRSLQQRRITPYQNPL